MGGGPVWRRCTELSSLAISLMPGAFVLVRDKLFGFGFTTGGGCFAPAAPGGMVERLANDAGGWFSSERWWLKLLLLLLWLLELLSSPAFLGFTGGGALPVFAAIAAADGFRPTIGGGAFFLVVGSDPAELPGPLGSVARLNGLGGGRNEEGAARSAVGGGIEDDCGVRSALGAEGTLPLVDGLDG